MEEEITKAIIDGTLSEDLIKSLETKLSDAGKEELKKAQAFAAKRRDEEDKAKKAEETRKSSEENLNQTNGMVQKFRDEQINSAKTKFFDTYGIPVEQRAAYDEAFKTSDKGSMTSETIYGELENIHLILNKDTYVSAYQKQQNMQKAAQDHKEGSAGSYSAQPSGETPPEHSEEATNLAAEAGVSVQTAERVLRDGPSTPRQL